MKILITGGSGFIGSNFIYDLILNPEYEIYNLDYLNYSSNNNLNLISIKSNKNYNFKKIDLFDYKKLHKYIFLIKPDIIINFAAESHVDRSINSPKIFMDSNIIGTFNILEVSKNYISKYNKKNFKFIQISTDEVYGDMPKGKFATEISPQFPSSPYSASKASADNLVTAWGKTYGIPSIITHCTNNYGPYQFPEKFIPHMIIKAINNKKIPIYGDGLQVRDWLHVSDHVNAIKKIMFNGKANEIYNISSMDLLTNIDLVNKIYEILKNFSSKYNFNMKSYKEIIENVTDRPGHDRRYALQNKKIINTLKWNKKIDIDIGLKSTVKWYLDNLNWWESIIKNNYNMERLGL